MTKAGKQRGVKVAARSQRSGAWLGVFAAALLVVGGVWWARSASQNAQLGQEFPNQGQEHIAVGAQHPAYNSFPATSGWHDAQPQPWGAYSYEVAQETLVHNLEHGGVVIQYNPEVLKGSVSKLEAIQAQFPNKTVVAPNSKLKVALALTSWRRLYTLDSLDTAKVTEFVRRYKNRGPEQFPD